MGQLRMIVKLEQYSGGPVPSIYAPTQKTVAKQNVAGDREPQSSQRGGGRFGTNTSTEAFDNRGACGGQKQTRWVFIIAVPVCGVIYWWFADWWAYVELPDGPIPKFIMPWWWQIIESGIFGVGTGGVLAGMWWLAWWAWSRRRSRCI